MFAESTLFVSQLHKEMYFLRGSLSQSDMVTLTFNFESSFLYATIFLFTIQFSIISYLTLNFVIRKDQVFHWLKNSKKQWANELKRNLICVFTFLNTIEMLRFHGGIITVKNDRYYILYFKKNLKKSLTLLPFFI